MGLAAYSFGGALEPNWDPVYAGRYNLVWALHVEGTRLHTGGEFTTVSGLKQHNYAQLSTPLDTTTPTISGEAPAGGQTEVALGANPAATFSEAIDPSSLTNTTFTLTKPDGASDGGPLPATVSYDPATKKATLDPNADLELGVTYTATIKGGTGGVKDVAGNPLAADEAWSFTTTLPCTISGTTSAETLTGTSANDVICAGGGNDTIKALEGNDTIRGEAGADRLHGGIGDDRLDGGVGNDTLDSRDGVEGNDTLDGGGGTDTCMTDATEKSILTCEQ
jgi:Ca2+-binding RTX toxin-like protein